MCVTNTIKRFFRFKCNYLLRTRQKVLSGGNKISKKNNFITIRVSDENQKVLDSLCKRLELNRSDLIRAAVTQYFFINMNDPQKKNPKFILSQKIGRYVFEKLDESEIKEIANLSFQIGIEDDFVDKRLNPNFTKEDDQSNFVYQINMLVENIFPQNGQNWFKKVHAEFKKNKIIFTGSHSLGKNFSLFIYHLLKNYANYYQFKVFSKKMTENYVSTRFIPEDNNMD